MARYFVVELTFKDGSKEMWSYLNGNVRIWKSYEQALAAATEMRDWGSIATTVVIEFRSEVE